MSAAQIMPPGTAPTAYQHRRMVRRTVTDTVERVDTVEPERKAAPQIDDSEPPASRAARSVAMFVLLLAAGGFLTGSVVAFFGGQMFIASVFLLSGAVSLFGYSSLAGYE